MENKDNWVILEILMIPLLLLFAIYVYFGFYYRDSFLYHTRVNGIYVSGMSVEEANRAIIEAEGPVEYRLAIWDRDGVEESIDGKDVSFGHDYRYTLERLSGHGFKYNWPLESLTEREYRISPDFTFDGKRAEEALSGLKCVREAEMETAAASKEGYRPVVDIVLGERGYELRNEADCTPDADKLKQLILRTIADGRNELDLSKESYFLDLGMEEEVREKEREFKDVAAVQGSEIVYEKDGVRMLLSPITIASFLIKKLDGSFARDARGNFTFNEEKLSEYVDSVAENFDYAGRSKSWKKHDGGLVQVDYGTFGFEVDKEREKEELKRELLNGDRVTREPVGVEDKGQGSGEIGDTYVEVDMSAQKLYFVSENRIALTSDVVTGDMRRKRSTPQTVCYVYFKQKNRTLIGPDYRTPVKYWMAVYNHIGLHDATWRSSFGGDIYLRNGSHGCINLPLKTAERLYSLVEVGTPVVLYY